MGALPSFRDWVKTFWLLILLGLWVQFLQWAGQWFVFSLNLPLLIIHAVSVGTFFPVFYLAYVHYILWGKHGDKKLPSWFPSRSSWDEAIWQYSRMVLAAFVGMMPLFLLLIGGLIWVTTQDPEVAEAFKEFVKSLLEHYEEAFTAQIGISTTFTLALMHRWRRRDEERLAAKQREAQKESP
jgi:hypothetical protein